MSTPERRTTRRPHLLAKFLPPRKEFTWKFLAQTSRRGNGVGGGERSMRTRRKRDSGKGTGLKWKKRGKDGGRIGRLDKQWKKTTVILGVRICVEVGEQPFAVMDGFTGQAGPTGRESDPSRLVQRREVVLGQASGNATQPGSGPVNQARPLMAFQEVQQHCVCKK